MMRFASVKGARSADEVRAYLPDNYEVYGHRFPDGPSGKIEVLIRGRDFAGWTLDDYVIPRLGSGSMACSEARYMATAVVVSTEGEDRAWDTVAEPLRHVDAVQFIGIPWQVSPDGDAFAEDGLFETARVLAQYPAGESAIADSIVEEVWVVIRTHTVGGFRTQEVYSFPDDPGGNRATAWALSHPMEPSVQWAVMRSECPKPKYDGGAGGFGPGSERAGGS